MRLERKTQKIFGENAPSQEITAFSTTSGTPVFSKDVAVIQNAEWEEGWFEETNNGDTRPYAEDRNAVDYTVSRQLAYIFQEGISEWDAGTKYHINSIVKVGSVLYISTMDANLNINPTTSLPSQWIKFTLSGEDVGLVGEVKMYAGDAVPSPKWMFCRGQALDRTQYATLFNRIGTLYGAGNNSTTFNIPDFRGRIAIGAGQDTSINTCGKKIGSLNHSHTVKAHYHDNLSNLYTSNSGDHSHPITDKSHSHEIAAKNTIPNTSSTAFVSMYTHGGGEAGRKFSAPIQPTYTGITATNQSAHSHQAGSFLGYIGTKANPAINGDIAQTSGANNPPCLVCNYIIKVIE